MNSTSGNHAVQGIGVTPHGSHRGKEKDLCPYRGDLEAGSEACQTFPQMGQGKHWAAFVVSHQHGVVSCVHLISTNLTSCIWKGV